MPMKASAFGGSRLAGVVGTVDGVVVMMGFVFIGGNDNTSVLALPNAASPTPSSLHVT